MKKGSDLSNEDIERYIDWVKEYGLEKAQNMQKEVLKNRKKFRNSDLIELLER